VTDTTIVIDNDVSLDGQGNLTVDGNLDHPVFKVDYFVNAWLLNLTVTRGWSGDDWAGGIMNYGDLTLERCRVTHNVVDGYYPAGDLRGSGIWSKGTLLVYDSTISENELRGDDGGAAIYSFGTLIFTNSTVSGNTHGGIAAVTALVTNSTVSSNSGGGFAFTSSSGTATMTHTTVTGNTGYGIAKSSPSSTLFVKNSLVDGDCILPPWHEGAPVASAGGNLESTGDTCGFDQPTDQVNVADPMLGPLQDNGGPTQTHALLQGSVAIDRIPQGGCIDADGQPLTTDQRGEPRDSMCDVGAFEVQP